MELIHSMDVAQHLLDFRATSVLDWAWAKQLRFYAPSRGGAKEMVRMGEGTFAYTYEYQVRAGVLRTFITLPKLRD